MLGSLNRDDALPEAGAPRALLRCLRRVLPDDDVQRLVQRALLAAGRAELPKDDDDLVAFVRAHVMLALSQLTTPKNALALVDQLTAELAAGAARQPRSDAPRAASEPGRSAGPPQLSVPTPVLRQESGVHPTGLPRRASVVMVDADRFARASMARALVSAKCDVDVVDTTADLASLDSERTLDVIILRVKGGALGAAVKEAARFGGAAVIVCSDATRETAEDTLRKAGVTRFAVLGATVSSVDVVRQVGALVDAIATAYHEGVAARLRTT